MVPGLQAELGRPVTAEELAKFLGVDADYVRKHHRVFGGIRPPGGRRIWFFENLIAESVRRIADGN